MRFLNDKLTIEIRCLEGIIWRIVFIDWGLCCFPNKWFITKGSSGLVDSPLVLPAPVDQNLPPAVSWFVGTPFLYIKPSWYLHFRQDYFQWVQKVLNFQWNINIYWFLSQKCTYSKCFLNTFNFMISKYFTNTIKQSFIAICWLMFQKQSYFQWNTNNFFRRWRLPTQS